ncbi:MAG: SH3 domain-containing protein [Clostridia bacterium]|nr:SH3 domain-containing protein [Clostridia bacterium]
MKMLIALLLLLTLPLSSAQATILPAAGVDEGFAARTGIACTPAVILCENLSVYDARGDQGGKKVDTLHYSGQTIPVIESWDGYALIYYADGTKTGWVHSEYLLFDPAWYVCDQGTPVYAYPDTMAPRVGYLATGTEAPIITEYDDGRKEWVCVSLRGASGWIRKTARDTEAQTRFHPTMLAEIESAVLTWRGEAIFSNVQERMATLSTLLTHASDLGAEVSGCPFEATLKLYLKDGRVITIGVATDSCCIYRVDGRDYEYALDMVSWDGSMDNTVLLEVFDLNSWEDLLLPANG